MHSTRREALRSAALFGGALFFSGSLLACAADADDARGSSEEAIDQSEDALVTCAPPTISANHGHRLSVTPSDVAAGRAKAYSIAGASGHDHTVTITAAQFAQLAAGRPVMTTSTTAAGHMHNVSVSCTVAPPLACPSGAAATTISGNHGHSLAVPKADLAAGLAKTYSIQGSSSHPHQVSISSAQMATLKKGQSISVTSSLVLSHVHTVTVACA